ncbi:IclR family transcriptional regulator [Azospirillum sp. RWY-5-1]|uniref:IclR family transcriptional regulator n=1 Tax=Azospirillum oleiclasticum TaxID=2735135 RepID=A0ABX2T419_9PROT|nr:IclR family transcriptional regulator [Azospirillum oleiclasticum]NYZ11740.1 IclR family transcriptional regulator [Azospirillum oleiclasticum]NYZ18901.1 IclR family transcriptional regulator [Azospirillum oleiclasticum]
MSIDTESREAEEEGRRYHAPALEKGLAILELFADQPNGLTKTEVGRSLGRSVSEIFRVLATLERCGFISQTPGGDRYVLTLKLFEMANRHPPTKRLVAEARPLLQEVATALEQSCHLAMPNDGRIVVVAQSDAPSSMGFAVRLGAQVDLLNTASGHILLAFQAPDERDRMLAAWSRHSGTPEPADLSAHLDAIRQRGYEEMASYQIHGVVNLAFPVLDAHGHAVAAMTVPFLARIGDRISPSDVKTVLQDASRRLTAAIGGKPIV